MAKPLSEDLRVRVIEAVKGGMSRRAAAERFDISSASAVRIVREWRSSGAPRVLRRSRPACSFEMSTLRQTPHAVLLLVE
jgi:transposase